MSAAPIALIPGTRPGRVGPLLESLRRAEGAAESPLTIFWDSARGGDPAAGLGDFTQGTSGFRRVEIVELPGSESRSRQITGAVSAMLRDHESVIVLEDDVLVAPPFLRFMNDALATFADEERVACVTGCSFNVAGALPETFFLPGANCWAWATWRRAFTPARFDPAALLRELLAADLVYAFDAGGAEPLTQALQDAVFDGDESWSLCWMAVAVLAERLTLYPGRALAVNVDARAPAVAPLFDTALSPEPVRVAQAPAVADEVTRQKLGAALVHWRCGRSRSFRAYARLAGVLPAAVEKSLYSTLIRRRLGRNARRRGGTEELVPSGGQY